MQLTPGPSPVYSLDDIRKSAGLHDTVILEEREVDFYGLSALWVQTEMEQVETGERYSIAKLYILVDSRSAILTFYGTSASSPEGIADFVLDAQSASSTASAELSNVDTSFPKVTWQTNKLSFADPILGLAVDVPSDWNAWPRRELFDLSRLESPCLGWSAVPPCTSIDIQLIQAFHDLDEIREHEMSQKIHSDMFEVVAEHTFDLHGWPALWLEAKEVFIENASEIPVIRVYISVNEQIVMIHFRGDLSRVSDIIDSVHPVETSQSAQESG
jgi:hypothetical protein